MIGMSMLNTMILASTLVVTGTAFSILHSTLPVLSYKSTVGREYGRKYGTHVDKLALPV